MNGKNKKIGASLLTLVVFSVSLILFLPNQEENCNGRCYSIHEEYDFGSGGYPRMTQVDDLLLVAYSNGSFILGGINLTSNEKIDPITIIPQNYIDTARNTLLYSEDLELLICVFNHNSAASCGIAWASKDNIFDPNSWTVQQNIVGPVYQEFFHIGLWEPFLESYNSTTFLLYFSNQTIYDPDNPIDDTNYSFELEGYDVVQKIDTFWIIWNGTEFQSNYCGTASKNLSYGTIHYKDGMASSVLVSENSTHKEYLMTFEAFVPPEKAPMVTMVKIQVSDQGMQTLWRRRITYEVGGAPFICKWRDFYVVSYRSHYQGKERVGFIGMKEDEQVFSHPIYLNETLFGWPSVYTDNEETLWLAADNSTNWKVSLTNITLEFKWKR